MTSNTSITAVILAAGLSERMGRFKPLLPLGTDTTIARVVKTFQAAGIGDVLVVTGNRADEVRQAVASLSVRTSENRDYRQGMFTSVLTGILALPKGCSAFFIHPVDIPLVRYQTVRRLAAAFEDTSPAILYPTFDNRRGHPTLISTGLAPEILKWPGAGGLRAFLRGHDADSLDLAVADEGILLEMDTPADYGFMQARLSDDGIPTENECRALMEAVQALPAAVVAHCRKVAIIAQLLAEALNAAGVVIDRNLVRTAALLHDISRTEKHHAQAGARLLENHGFARLAPLVRAHVDLDVNVGQPVEEAQIVYLADKLAAGDQIVDLEERFGRKMAKYGQDPCAASRIEQRRESARRIRDEVERITGLSLASILEGAEPGEGESGERKYCSDI